MISTKMSACNPYVHFGQTTLWPRGYPLDKIGVPNNRTYEVCSNKIPTIQQGVVNGDPDVDALMRLTRRHFSRPLNLRFDQMAPAFILPSGTFAPFNSQNTLYLKRAFWGLLLPTMVTDRVTDIYRSYWAQRLMWLIGDNLGFLPPNAVTKRGWSFGFE